MVEEDDSYENVSVMSPVKQYVWLRFSLPPGYRADEQVGSFYRT